MKKYKNTSGKDVAIVIGGKTYDWQNGETREMDEFKMDMFKDAFGKIKEIKVEPAVPERPTPVEKPTIKKYSRTQLFRMRKAEQVEMLESLGVKKIPGREADRVKKLLSLQKKG